MNLGERLIKIRKNNKMSQEEATEIIGVSRQTISSWENSKSYPAVRDVIKISDSFNISVDVLLKSDMFFVKKIDSKIKFNNVLKIIVFCLLLVYFCSSILVYLFPDKFLNYGVNNLPVPVYNLKCNKGDFVYDFYIRYNKFFNYPVNYGYATNDVTDIDNIDNLVIAVRLKKFKSVDEVVMYLKGYYEKEQEGICYTYSV